MGSNGRTRQRPPPNVSAHTYKPKVRRGNPRRGFPLRPPPALMKHKGVPRSAERGQGRRPWTLPPLKRWTKLSNARCAKKTRQPSPPSRARNVPSTDRQRSRGWWSRQGKKSAFLWRLDTVSLGKHQRNGVERQQGLQSPSQRIGAHVQGTKIKGGNPLIGFPPWTPFLIFCEQKESSALCGARPGTLSLDPAAFEKAGETFRLWAGGSLGLPRSRRGAGWSGARAGRYGGG